jgi:hypothetical protein
VVWGGVGGKGAGVCCVVVCRENASAPCCSEACYRLSGCLWAHQGSVACCAHVGKVVCALCKAAVGLLCVRLSQLSCAQSCVSRCACVLMVKRFTNTLC